MSKRDVATLRTSNRRCSFCKECDDVEVLFGQFYSIGKISVHHFCLLLSSRLTQRGKDNEGVLGFLYDDITAELRRASKRKCYYCGNWAPTLHCDYTGCGRLFHLPCGRRNGALNLFHDQFQSYCAQHRPQQRVPVSIVAGRAPGTPGTALLRLERLKLSRDGVLICPKDVPDLRTLHIGPQSRAVIENVYLNNDVIPKSGKVTGEWHTCGICYEHVTPLPTPHTLWPPCCKGDRWFHRICVSKLALSAGRHYVKCPLCNNQPIFLAALYQYGFYVPDQDASWERESGAFRELHERPKQCYVERCLYAAGRDKAGSKRWQLVICSLCGSQAAHRACANITTNRSLICSRCRPDTSRNNHLESEKDCGSVSAVSDLEKMTDVRTRRNSVSSICDSDYSTNDDNYLRKDNIHLINDGDALSKNQSITSWRDSIMVSMSQASTSKTYNYDYSINSSDDYFTLPLKLGTDNISKSCSKENNDISQLNDTVTNSDKILKAVITQNSTKPLTRRSLKLSFPEYVMCEPRMKPDKDVIKKNDILRKRSISVFVPSVKVSEKKGVTVTYSADDLNIASKSLEAKSGTKKKNTFDKDLHLTQEQPNFSSHERKPVNLLRGTGSQKRIKVKILPKIKSPVELNKSVENVSTLRSKDTFKGKIEKYFEHLEELKKKRNITKKPKCYNQKRQRTTKTKPKIMTTPEKNPPALTTKACPKSKKTFYVENEDTISLEDQMDEEEQATVKYKIIDNDFAKVITSRRVYTVAIPKNPQMKHKKRNSAEIGQTNITSYFCTLDNKVESGVGVINSVVALTNESVGNSYTALTTDKSSVVALEDVSSQANLGESLSKKVVKKRFKWKHGKNKKRAKKSNKSTYLTSSDLVNGDVINVDKFNGDVLTKDVLSGGTRNAESEDVLVNGTEINYAMVDRNNDTGDNDLSECILLDGDVDMDGNPTANSNENGDMTICTNKIGILVDETELHCATVDRNNEIVDNELSECILLVGDVDKDCSPTANSNENGHMAICTNKIGILVDETELHCAIVNRNNEIVDNELSECILLNGDVDKDGNLSANSSENRDIQHADLNETDEIASDVMVRSSKANSIHFNTNSIIISDCEIISSSDEFDHLDCKIANSNGNMVNKKKSFLRDYLTNIDKPIEMMKIKDGWMNVEKVAVIKTVSDETAKGDDLPSNKMNLLNDVSLHFRRTTKRVIKHDFASSIKVEAGDDAVKSDIIVIDDNDTQSNYFSTKKEAIATHYNDLIDRKQLNDDCIIVNDHKPLHKRHDAGRKRKINCGAFIHKAAEHVGIQNVNFMITECDASHSKRRRKQRLEMKSEFVNNNNRPITDFFNPVTAAGASMGESSFSRQHFNKNFWMGGSDYLKRVRSDIRNRKRRMNKSRCVKNWYD